MNDERWKEVVGTIKDRFGIAKRESSELSEEDGPGSIEVVEFAGPLGTIRLERITRPLLLDTKSLGSKRIGSERTIQYTYSDSEVTHTLDVYRWNPDASEWEEIKLEKGQFLF